MINTILFWAVLAVGGAADVLYLLRQTHMLQLNSYSAAEQLHRIRENPDRISSGLFALVFAVIAILPVIRRMSAVFGVLFLCMTALLAYMNFPKKKAKKPLVYTARVKRLLATEGFFTVLMLAAAIVFKSISLPFYGYAALFFGYAVIPLVVLLSNAVNAPIEAAVRGRYIKEAQELLAGCPSLTVIGITGSYGKTSMKFFLTTLLREKYNVLMTPESYNTPMGVVKTVRGGLKGYHEIFVCEMGAKKLGEIKELCDIVHPKYGIITSIGEQHLESFKSIENIISTKTELAREATGECFVCADNKYIRANLPKNAVTYGAGEDSAYRYTVNKVGRNGTEFSVRLPDGSVIGLATRLIGEHNVENLCGAVAMAHFLGVTPAEIQKQMAKITPVPHRLQLIERGGCTIIDDAFNSNPAGAAAALKALALFEGYKVLVTPGMVELGEREAELNRQLGQNAAAVCDFVALVGKKQTEPILDGLRSASFPEDRIFAADTLGKAMERVFALPADGQKVILLENDLPDNY